MEMLSISKEDFNRLTTFIHNNYGIDLSKKKSLIEARLQFPFSKSGYTSFSDYIENTMHDPAQVEMLLNKLTTNHTFFMRESGHFEYFRDVVLPRLEQTKNNRVISVWSAGCSSGEEPYTLSMILKDYFSKKGRWDTRVLATDISQNALEIAKTARYSTDSIEKLPRAWKEKYLVINGDSCQMSPEIQQNVIFRTFNLMDPIRFRIKFDVIFCRNVMIYFDADTKVGLVNRFFNATEKDGCLFVGLSENLVKEQNPYTMVDIGVYQKKL